MNKAKTYFLNNCFKYNSIQFVGVMKMKVLQTFYFIYMKFLTAKSANRQILS